MYNDSTLLFGIILGICFSGLIMLFTRDIIIRHFLKNIQVLGSPIEITQGDLKKQLDPKFIEHAEQATINYAKVLVEARNALEILVTCTEETEETREFFQNMKVQMKRMDEELQVLAEMGIVERKDVKNEKNIK